MFNSRFTFSFQLLEVYVRQNFVSDIVIYAMFGVYKIYKNAGLTFARCMVCNPLPLKGRVFKIQKKVVAILWGFTYQAL